jgi:hypothetical protein
MRKTKQILQVTVFVLLSLVGVFAQTIAEKRVIEVTGSAETLITPNEFTFRITLVERIENKQKLTIEMQEIKLKDELTKLGLDVQKDLTIFDLTSFYVFRKKVKDTLSSKDYRLKLRDLNKIEKLQEIADRLNITTLDLIESTHSELTGFRRQTKMDAIKAAKAKAEYMLGAIGEKVGKAVFIQEIPDEQERNYFNYGLMSNGRSNITSNTISTDNQGSSDTLTFSKIKLRYAVLAKFEIQ